MALKHHSDVGISEDLLDAIRSFPVERRIEHCGVSIRISPFDFYADCPQCGARIKVRSMSGVTEIEDIFDAVFEWLHDPQASRVAEQRRQILEAEHDEED